jgi:hypothetical protein
MLMMKKLNNLEFEPLHPINVLLASVVHGISCLFNFLGRFGVQIYPALKKLRSRLFLMRRHVQAKSISALEIFSFKNASAY